MNSLTFDVKEDGKISFRFNDEKRFVSLEITFPDYAYGITRQELDGSAYSNRSMTERLDYCFEKRKAFLDTFHMLEANGYTEDVKFVKEWLMIEDPEIFNLL